MKLKPGDKVVLFLKPSKIFPATMHRGEVITIGETITCNVSLARRFPMEFDKAGVGADGSFILPMGAIYDFVETFAFEEGY